MQAPIWCQARCWVLQSFQCGKAPQLRSPSGASPGPGVGQGTTACSLLSNSPVRTSRSATTTQGAAGCHGAVSSNPDIASDLAPAHTSADSSKERSGTLQRSSAKRKKGSKAEELPSLQDAAGLPERLGDQPLRLIIVGHNPSDHAW